MLSYRTHTCGELRKIHIGSIVTLSGWVNRRRDHGGVVFIDLRDKFGITQLLIDPSHSPSLRQISEDLRSEWVLRIEGKVISRAEGMENPNLPTGAIEIQVHSIEILSKAKTPPFSVAEEISEVSEELRLKYRYLDLRRGPLLHNLQMRSKATHLIRNYFISHGFTEVTTPILGKSTPEGARDYIVPSRVHPGNFYALPQSPQLFKQLLMVSGLDRYFQIAQCFRDEDLRADRQPEFTQVDIEMSFATPEDIMHHIERLITILFSEILGKSITPPFLRMSYQDAMEKYGTDRPDLRYGLELHTIDAIAAASGFSIFHQELAEKGTVKALCVPQGASVISRKEIERYTELTGKLGLKGLAWMKCSGAELTSNIAKFFPQDLQQSLIQTVGAKDGDLLFFAAGKKSTVNQSLDHLRRQIAKDLSLAKEGALAFLWVTDFPLLDFDEEENRYVSVHHPFTAPHRDDLQLLDTNPLSVRSHAYDIVLNGYEIGGGSQRIHDQKMQRKIFELLALSEDDIKQKFGFFAEALEYGTPPHLGLALGLDRIMMLLLGTDNIRDVIAFPKTQKASDVMMNCPSRVHPKQLKDVRIHVDKEFDWI